MSFYPINDGEVQIYKQLEKKVLFGKEKKDAKAMDLEDALAMSECEGMPQTMQDM